MTDLTFTADLSLTGTSHHTHSNACDAHGQLGGSLMGYRKQKIAEVGNDFGVHSGLSTPMPHQIFRADAMTLALALTGDDSVLLQH